MQTALTENEIIDDLHRLGLERGAVLEVHSSMRRMGFVEGGASAVINALMKVVGEEGAIVMPAYLVTPLLPLTEEEKRKGLTADSLAKSVRQVLSSQDMVTNALTLGAAMSRENGVDAAIELIESRLGQRRPT